MTDDLARHDAAGGAARQPSAAAPEHRHAVDVEALERGALVLGPLSDSLRAMATQLVHAQSDPGDPPAADDVLDLQAAASDALFALSRGLDESAGLLRVSAHGYRGAEEDVGRTLRRLAGEGP